MSNIKYYELTEDKTFQYGMYIEDVGILLDLMCHRLRLTNNCNCFLF